MALARTYDAARGGIVVSVAGAYKDRLSRWSDIREYLPFLHEEARNRVNPVVLEAGTRKGNSTLAFLAGIRGGTGHVWSVDVNDVTADPDGMFLWRDYPAWTFVRGDDMDLSVQSLLPAQADILFIDSSHEYEHTLDECRAYMPRVTPGGVALFHDTRLMMHREDTEPPVKRALDDWCRETGMSWEEIPGDYGLGVIRL